MNLLSEYRKVYENYWLNNPVWGWKRKIMSEVLRHLEKYRWHDLQENPKDFPPVDEDVLLLLDWDECIIGHISDPDGYMWRLNIDPFDERLLDGNPDPQILAWRLLDTPEEKVYVK